MRVAGGGRDELRLYGGSYANSDRWRLLIYALVGLPSYPHTMDTRGDYSWIRTSIPEADLERTTLTTGQTTLTSIVSRCPALPGVEDVVRQLERTQETAAKNWDANGEAREILVSASPACAQHPYVPFGIDARAHGRYECAR
jgi:hypothetical protein